MSRERDRIAKRLEANPVVECNRIQQKFFPELMSKFGDIEDPRHQSYITYSIREMFGTLYYKCIGNLDSMRSMDTAFNNENVVKNLYEFIGGEEKEYLPHSVTLNDLLSEISPEGLESIQHDLVSKLIRRKTFDDARILKKWMVIIDGVELDEGNTQKNKYYLSRTYHRGESNEFTKYHRSMLEAKVYFGNNLVCSMLSEPIENSEEYNEKCMSDEAIKQDCESKAFVRLAEKLKSKYPRLPICIVADGLYVSTPVIKICEDNGWNYIIRYKEGCAPSIAADYNGLPEHEKVGNDIEYANQVIFHDYDVNVIHFTEKKQIKGELVETKFCWITNFKITKTNARRIVEAGRGRWKIENQGFNRQKHWQGNIEHACSWNERAQKNHYLMVQLADFMKQLYEYYFLAKNGIKKAQKNISSELLVSFGRQLVKSEDIKKPRENENVLR